MKPTTSLHTQSFNTARHRVAANVIAALSAATLLTACGGGSPSASTTDGTVSLATVTTGYIPSPVTPAPTAPISTTPTAPMTVGAVLTDVRLQNTGAAQTNVPFTIGQVFPSGALTTTEGLAAKLSNGTVMPLQVDVKATHADGSVRHAIISGVLPSLAAGQTETVQLAKSNASAKGTVTPQSLLDAGLTGSINITVDGVKYTASLADALKTATPINWLSGNVANEWIVSAPLKDANGAAHPLLTARFDVRWYSGLSKQARVEFVVENDKTFVSNSKYTYDVNLELGGRSVYSKAGLTHYNRARWHQYAWWDAAREPAVNVQLNASYMIASKAVPNYDQSYTPSETNLANLAKSINATNTGPMTIGPVVAYMGTTGGRADIGSLPSWSVMWLLSMDKRARDVMMAAADGSGSWSIHLRDENTDYPVRTDNEKNSQITTHGNLVTRGPLAVPRCVNNDNTLCSSPYAHDTAHQPSLAYLPYMVTGDYYYLEELQFWAASNPLETAPGYNGNGQGLVRWQQLRGQAWSLRTLGQVAYITPDTHPLKSYFTQQVDNNLNYYNTTFVVANPNKLGVYDGSGDNAFSVESSAPWQDDFFTWSFGYLAELGFSKALPILQWKAKYSVGRMTDPGYCWIAGAAYNLTFLDANKKVFGSFADLYNANFAGNTITFDNVAPTSSIRNGVKFSDLACGSQAQADFLGSLAGFSWKVGTMIGYADSALGYPANMQPALAMAVTAGAENAPKAWEIFMSRANKPDYRTAPQWAIIPR
jgi:hypothetical protein